MAKQRDQAIGYYRAALALRPVAPAHNTLGVALYENGQLEEAIEHYQRPSRSTPNPPRP
jgi:tetratricopeptide (TPR) repeat protein